MIKDRTRIDWDAAGALSIVIQGGLFVGNAAETGNHCRHWRDQFPKAQIILAISSTDLLADARPGPLRSLRPCPRFAGDSLLAAALDLIGRACDRIVLAESALPLPPIKTISDRPNNINLQIAAAKAGLAQVVGRYVIRVRSDLIFADRRFLDQYEEGRTLPRGSAALLDDRVLISGLYTLNPFTYERMPLHFSDWFHVGLSRDVRFLWDVPPMSYADAIHYKTHPCSPMSNADERLIVPRLAVEQYILSTSLRKRCPELTLDFHNDLRSRDLTNDILVDNFVVCDVGPAGCVFDKYGMDFFNPAKSLHCITYKDWLEMARASGAARRAVLETKQRQMLHPEEVSFPRHYPTAALKTKIGQRNHDEIFVGGGSGVVLHGPYDTLPRGRYVARVDVSTLDGHGFVDLRATEYEGRAVLSERRIAVDRNAQTPFELPFDIDSDVTRQLEIVATIELAGVLAIRGLTISRRADSRPDTYRSAFAAVAQPMQTNVGVNVGEAVATSGRAGRLLYGPHIEITPGSYRATFLFRNGRSPGRAFVDVVEGDEHRALVRQRIRQADLDAGRLELELSTDAVLTNVELRIWTDRRGRFEIVGVELEKIKGQPTPTSYGVGELMPMTPAQHLTKWLRGIGPDARRQA